MMDKKDKKLNKNKKNQSLFMRKPTFIAGGYRRSGEAGNVFFTLFGAVAVVGVLGAGIMATMRGPLSTMVEINRIEEAKSEIRLAQRLILAESARSPVADSSPGDTLTEPTPPETDATCTITKGTGFGCIPASVGSDKTDPWGTQYRYCAWNLGVDSDAEGNWLVGDADTNNIALAVISAGPDRTFQTTCVDDNAGTNDYMEPDGGGGDDIAMAMDYIDAVAGSGGLWEVDSGTNKAAVADSTVTEIDLTGTTGPASSIGLRLGAASMILPTQADLATCDAANDGLIRMNTTGVYQIQICQNGTGWLAAGSLWNLSGSNISYTAGKVTAGNALDVTGATTLDGTLSVTASNATTLGGTLGVTGATTLSNTLGVTGATTLSDTLGVTGATTLNNTLTVSGTNATSLGGTLGVTGATTLNNTLTVSGTNATSLGGTLDVGGDVAVNTNSFTVNATTGDTVVGGDLTVSGDDLTMATNTSGHVLVADGSNFNPVAMGGDATIASNGDLTIANDAITNVKIADDAVDTAEIADNAITNAQIADDAVDTAELADDAVTYEKMSGTGGTNDQCLMIVSGDPTWATCTPGGTGSGGGYSIEDAIDAGNDANNKDIIDLYRIGTDRVCNADLSWCVDVDNVFSTLEDADQDTGIDADTAGDGSADSIVFTNNGSESMRLSNTGNLGLGTTSPAAKLTILGGTLSVRETDDGNEAVGIGAGAQTGYISLRNDGTENVIIRSAVTGQTLFNAGPVIFGGTTSDASAKIQIDSTSQGFLMPRMTTAQRDAVSTPATGLMVYNTSTNTTDYYNGSAWVPIGGSGGTAGSLTDADGDTQIQVEESSDDDTIRFDTDGTERMVIAPSGNVGIGTATPSDELQVAGDVKVDDSLILGLTAGNAPTYISPTFTIADDSLDWDKFVDSMTLDATTSINMDTNSADLNFDNDTLFIDSSANRVGIGTNSPVTNFQIHEDTSGTATLLSMTNADVGSTATDGFQISVGTTGYTEFKALENIGMSFQTNGLQRLRIGQSGSLKVGLGTPLDSAIFEIESTAQGFLPPRMTTTQRDAISSPATGLQVYNTSTNLMQFYNGSSWTDIGTGASGGVTEIDDLSDAATDYATDFNLFMGSNAGANNPVGAQYNIAIGQNAFDSASKTNNAGHNTALGYSALTGNTTGAGNTAIGRSAMGLNTEGHSNVAVGRSALYPNTTGDHNVALGHMAGRYIADGSTANTITDDSVYLGALAKANADNQTNQIVIGYDATGIGSNSVVLGNDSIATTALKGNVGIGTTAPEASALLDVTSTTRGFLPPRMTTTQRDAINSGTFATGLTIFNTTTGNLEFYDGSGWVSADADNGGSVGAIDDLSDAINDTTGNNLALGHEFPSLGVGSQNTAIGSTALDSVSSGIRNVAIGYDAATDLNTGSTNVFIGWNTGKHIGGESSIVAIGGNAATTSASNTVIIGSGAGRVAGATSVAIGAGALSAGSAENSVVLGYQAGQNIDGGANVVVGYQSGIGATDATAANNVFVGNLAGQNIDGGNNNIFVGFQTGDATTDGSDNILIGYDVDATSATSSNELNIGNTIYGDLSTGRVGVGVADATAIDASALVEFDSTTRGFLAPRMTNTQRDAIVSPATSLLVFSITDNEYQYNNGTPAAPVWVPMSGSVCSDPNPDAFNFTNLASQVVSTVVTSNIEQITGVNCAVTVSLSGESSAQVRTCSDSSCSTEIQTWTSSAQVSNNEYVQLRLTTSAIGGASSNVTATIGSGSDFWSVSTAGGDCTVASPTVGTVCADGTVYAGQTPDGNVKMYTTRCDHGQTWSGSACTGTRTNATWSTTATISNSLNDNNTGFANTYALDALVNADAPYNAADFCANLNQDGHTDWYLPARFENEVMYTGRTAIGNFANDEFWSSTEAGISNARTKSYASGSNLSRAKNTNNRIRCVRKDGATPPAGTPGGADGEVQFNNSGSLDGSSSFVWDDTNDRLGIGTNTPQSRIHIAGTPGSLAEGITFGDGDSGMYENVDDNEFRFTLGGTVRWFMSQAAFRTNTATGPGMSAFSPNFAPRFNDPNTGMGRTTSNVDDYLGFYTNGTEALTIDDAQDIGVGTGSTIDGSAKFEIISTTKGFLPPRMTTTQRDAISSPATGLTVYNTSTNLMQFYNGSSWTDIGTGAGGGVTEIDDLSDVYHSTNIDHDGDSTATNDDNLAIGHELTTLDGSNPGARNTAIGRTALDAITTGDDNIAIGYNAGTALTTGEKNVFIGRNAGIATVSGVQSVVIGDDAAGNGAIGGSSIAIGHRALRDGGGTGNVAIGLNALSTVGNGSNNIGIGNNTLTNLSNASDRNIAIGHGSGSDLTSGSKDNILIGSDVEASTAPTQFELNIGGVLFGNLGDDAGTPSVTEVPSIGIGVADAKAIDGSSILELDSTTQGFLAPRMTNTQRDAIVSPATSLLVFSITDNEYQYNNGTPAAPVWVPMSGSVCSDPNPDAFNFTNLASQVVSTVVTSNIEQITGVNCAVTVSLSGESSAQVRTCSDSSCSTEIQTWTSSAQVSNNEYVQLRLTTSAIGGASSNVTATIGSGSDFWSVSTAGGDCTVASPIVGTVCADGTVYAGQTPDGNVKMYTTRCDHGQTWSGSACTGTRTIATWATTGTIDNNIDDANTGFANTYALDALVNADAPYNAADFCANLNQDGHTDWYLPARFENNVLYAGRTAIGNFANDEFWSSSENNATSARSKSFASGTTPTRPKTGNYRIRCVRKDGVSPPAGTPGGADGEVQFNNSGSLDGSSSFVWDDTNDRLGIGTNTPVAQLDIRSASGGAIIKLDGADSLDSALHLFTSGTGTLGGGARGWSIFGRGDSFVTTAEREDFAISFYDSSSWNRAFTIDHATQNVGIGTATPLRPTHIQVEDLSLGAGDYNNLSGLLVEGADSYIEVISNNSGSSGSAIYLNEVTGGTFADSWVLHRGTSTGSLSSALQIKHGPDISFGDNTLVAQFETTGQMGLGGAAGASAMLQVDSTTRGFLPPRMTTTQRDAISSPATGLQVYNTSTNTLDFYNGSAWTSFASSAGTAATLIDADSDTSIEVDRLGDGSQENIWVTVNGNTAAHFSTAGQLYLGGGSGASHPLVIQENQATSGSLETFIKMRTSGANAGTVGAGPVLEFAPNNDTIAYIGAVFSDVTGGSEDGDIVFHTMTNGAAADEKMRITAAGTVGIGTSAPEASALLDVTSTTQGFLAPRMTNTQRDAIVSPATSLLVFSITDNEYQYNNGTPAAPVWVPMSGSVCSDPNPDAFDFTNLASQVVSTVVTSNIEQITGVNCAVTVSLSGESSAQVRTCSDSSCSTEIQTWTSSAQVSNNEYVQLRLTTSATGGASSNVTATIGSGSDFWSVSTAGGDCTVASPTVGTVCADGTVYAGQTPDGNVKMYASRCDAGQTWSGSACTGTRTFTSWSTTGTINNAVVDSNTGFANTYALDALVNADAPYNAADYCANLNQDGHTDWYLPASGEHGVLYAGYTAIGNFLNNEYWSSRENTISSAVARSYNGGASPVRAKTDNKYIRCVRKDGATPPAGTPGGADGEVQFNNSGSLDGSSSFVWDDTNDRLGIGEANPAVDLVVAVPRGTSGGIHLLDAADSNNVRARIRTSSNGHGMLDLVNASGTGTISLHGNTNSISYINTAGLVVGGTTQDGSSMLEISSTTKGFLPPRMTTTQRDAINSGTFATGLTIYNTDTNTLQYYDGSAWQNASAAGGLALDDLSDAEVDANNNMFIGDVTSSGAAGTTRNLGLGLGTLPALDGTGTGTNGDNNTAIGYEALNDLTRGAGNTAVGSMAGDQITDADNNTAIGAGSMNNNTIGSHNTVIGANAMGNPNNNGALIGNTLIGSLAGANMRAGANNNLLIGYQAGDVITTGTDNIIIGYDVDPSSATATNELNIGNTLYGNLSTGNIGIGKTNPGSRLTILGGNFSLRETDDGNEAVGIGSGASTGYITMRNDGTENVIIRSSSGQTLFNAGPVIFGGIASDASAKVQIDSTTQGFLLPRMTAVQRDAINSGTFATGLTIYNTDTNTLQYYDGSAWQNASAAGGLNINDLSDAYHDTTTDFDGESDDDDDNLAIGHLFASLDGVNPGARNVAVGATSMDALTSGDDNVTVGYQAGTVLTTGRQNTFIGSQAGSSNTGGNFNTVVGYLAGSDIISGSNIALFGQSAGKNTTGADNTAFGSTALFRNTTGTGNVAVGRLALQGTTNGAVNNNTAIGTSAGVLLDSGAANNIMLGYQAGDNVTTGTDNIIIGYDIDASSATATNELNIGGTIYGYLDSDRIGIGALPASGVELDVTGDIQYTGTITDVSDRRLKTDIQHLDPKEIVSKITQIDTYSFKMKGDETGLIEYGVMAQEIEEIFPELVRTADDDMGTKSVNYVGLIAPMIEATKSLQSENDALKAELASLKTDQEKVLAAFDTLSQDVQGLKVHTGYGTFQANMMMLALLMLMFGGAGFVFFTWRRVDNKQS